MDPLNKILQPKRFLLERTKSQGALRSAGQREVGAFWNLNGSAHFKNEMVKSNLKITLLNDSAETTKVYKDERVVVTKDFKDYRNPAIRRDVIQDMILEKLISQHNEESSKFSSPFIRLGAFL